MVRKFFIKIKQSIWLNRFFVIALTGVTLAYVVEGVISESSQMNWGNFSISIPTIMTVMLILGLAYIIRAYLWVRAIRITENQVRTLDGMKIFLAAQLGRYIPGKIWQFFTIGILSSKLNLHPTHTVSVTFFLLMLYYVVGFLLAGFVLVDSYQFVIPITCLLVGGILVLIIFLDKVLLWTSTFLTAISKTEVRIPNFSRGDLSIYFFAYFLIWVLLGSTLWYVLEMISPHAIQWSDIKIISIMAAGCISGYLALFSPSGIGVREAVLVILLSPIYGKGNAGVAVLLLRILMTLTEVILGLWGGSLMSKYVSR